MKTIKFSLIIIISMLAINVNAQFKVLSNGYVAIGSTTVPANYSVYINSGKILMGKGSTYPFLNYDLWCADPRIWSSSGRIILYNSTNNTYNDLAVRNLTQYSDAKDKINITTLTDGLSTIKKLRGVSFNWKKQITESDRIKNYGLIAQEVEKVIPEATTSDSLGNKLLYYNAIIPYLIEAVKDLSDQVESLKKQASVNLSKSNSKTTTETIGN